MDKKQIKKELVLGSIYFLISTPLAFLVTKAIELKYTEVFWNYIAITGISAIIASFYDSDSEDEKIATNKSTKVR